MPASPRSRDLEELRTGRSRSSLLRAVLAARSRRTSSTSSRRTGVDDETLAEGTSLAYSIVPFSKLERLGAGDDQRRPRLRHQVEVFQIWNSQSLCAATVIPDAERLDEASLANGNIVCPVVGSKAAAAECTFMSACRSTSALGIR